MKSKLNREWHMAHRMPEKATIDERIVWHLEHSKNCSCREIPAKLLAEMKKRKIRIPAKHSRFRLNQTD